VAKGRSAAQIGRDIRADLSATIATVMVAANHALVAANPVDTQHSANNWIISKGRPFPGVDGSRESPSDAAQQAGIAGASTYDIGRDGRLVLGNNVDYIEDLDGGSSPQAEPGWVARAFAEGVAAAPRGRRTAARRMLAGLAKRAYQKGA
jgi:hypothetical protein